MKTIFIKSASIKTIHHSVSKEILAKYKNADLVKVVRRAKKCTIGYFVSDVYTYEDVQVTIPLGYVG